VLQDFDYVFSENGLVAYKRGELLAVQASSSKCAAEWRALWECVPVAASPRF
jgi:hypothetical protein